jgi:ABC-type transport system involved in cytochrome c biogenesis ATPase subunit
MITLVDVVQHYDVRPVLRDINLAIPAGQLVAIVGPNGMGKSTLLRVMAGTLAPQRGYVEIDGLRRRGSVETEIAIRRRVCFLPDHPWLAKRLTGREFLSAVGALYEIDSIRLLGHIDRLLTLFDLEAEGDWPISSYSNGQQKKIALAGALVMSQSSTSKRQPSLARPVIAWLRFVAPPYWAVISYLVVLVGLEVFAHTIFAPHHLSPFDEQFNRQMWQLVHTPRDTWLVVGMVAWSLWRVGSTHPFYLPRYAAWLESTPWKLGLPLPAGPIELVAQDGVVLAFGTLWLQHAAKLELGWLFAAFAIPYLGALAIACFGTFAVGEAYLIGFGLALAVWLQLPSAASVAVLIALYPVAMLGVRRSLARFPWGARSSQSLQDLINRQFGARPGWPFTDLAPAKSFPQVSPRDALVFPWLAAAWLFALASCSAEDREIISLMVPFYVAVGAAILRAAIYVLEFRPPIGLFGRIATGRLLIPGYDRVWLPLIGAVLVLAIELRLSKWAVIVGPLALGVGLMIQLGMGPSLKTWALTAPHRLRLARGRNEMIEI